MQRTSETRAGQDSGDATDPEVLIRMAEAQAARWARHRRDVIAEIRRVMPSWPDDRQLRAYLIAASFLGAARGIDERQTA
jgi:hypothetical protein